ncbi:MAG: FMN-dependent NADH-azoreductase [Verrucomicrobium sp.]
MKTLLLINASGRVSRSITRQLTGRFANAWQQQHPDGKVIHRDVGLNPPPPVNEDWIAGAFGDPQSLTAGQARALETSNTLIEEIEKADLIAIGSPMYNFGMPSPLKAYIDQIVRVGRTFEFDPTNTESPYLPLLKPKPVVIITSVGDGAMQMGGSLAHLNFLEPHLATVFGFIGFTDMHFVRAGYDEYQDDRFRKSLVNAEAEVDRVVGALSESREEAGVAELV